MPPPATAQAISAEHPGGVAEPPGQHENARPDHRPDHHGGQRWQGHLLGRRRRCGGASYRTRL